MSTENILAKDTLSLLEHTQHVVDAVEVFAKRFSGDFDVNLARKGAVLHDLGKAHPAFQRKLQKTSSGRHMENFAHRHEISSLGFLPAFAEDEWNTLIDMVIAHHKSIVNDARERGILDLVNNDREVIGNHLQSWDTWHIHGINVLNEFGIAAQKIDRDAAERALWYVVEYCEDKTNGYSRWRGLLKSADHFASAFAASTKAQLKSLFEIPNLDFYHKDQRKSTLYPLSQISTKSRHCHTMVVAPTGAGKTDFLLRRCQKRIFYTLPFQASINAMYERIKNTVPNKDIRLLHATSKIIVGKNIDEQILQPLAGSAVKVLTPHQLASVVFGTPGFESVMLDIEGQDIILDEIHTYSDYSRSMVLEIVKALLRLNCRVHIGTATMPSILYTELAKILGDVYEVKLPEKVLESFNRHRIYKIADRDMDGILQKAFQDKQKVLVIFNTVRQAQEAYCHFKEKFIDIPTMLIHSRFRRGDRVELEKKLTMEFNDQYSPCLVVATQVVEVSLDISFDCMITQCAPLDSLIQRFGRVHRRRNENTIGTYKPIYILEPQKNVLPYKRDIVVKSYEVLPENGTILQEKILQKKLDIVYPDLDTKAIDIHLIYRDGQYSIRELTNNRKSVLLEALEIESATCILEEDCDKYQQSHWQERLNLEIPVSYKTIAKYVKVLEQLEVGRYPFVIPQKLEAYKDIGLQINEPDNFITDD